MNPNYLSFEQPIVELESKIEELRSVVDSRGGIAFNISEELENLQQKSIVLTETIFSHLSAWQITQVSRHSQRPYTLDYIARLFPDFDELKGDRAFADDPAIVCGLATLDTQPVMIIGHQKGRTIAEKVKRNFGMPKPEGYRKALRVMHLAEQWRLPILTFIDTPGAYPGIDAEERGQSEAIARNIQAMSMLKVPIIASVIGEGGSGGALAIGVADCVQMLQYSIYSVISPEGCASILWKSADKAADAAAAMGLTAERLLALGLIDEVIPEPLGAAHRNPDLAAASLRAALLKNLAVLSLYSPEQLVERRYQRLLSYGFTPT